MSEWIEPPTAPTEAALAAMPRDEAVALLDQVIAFLGSVTARATDLNIQLGDPKRRADPDWLGRAYTAKRTLLRQQTEVTALKRRLELRLSTIREENRAVNAEANRAAAARAASTRAVQTASYNNRTLASVPRFHDPEYNPVRMAKVLVADVNRLYQLYLAVEALLALEGDDERYDEAFNAVEERVIAIRNFTAQLREATTMTTTD